MEEETKNPLSPRQKAEMALNWALKHITNPCGQTSEEKEYMKKVHIKAVSCALKEAGVKETLSETEKEMLKILEVDIGPKTEPTPKP